MNAVVRSAALPILLATLALVPFLAKPFTIDDVTFLLEARHVLRDPLHPSAFNMVFEGERIRVSQKLASGPVMAYLLAPVVNSAKAEILSHLIQLALLVAGAVATASLALRLGSSRIQATVATMLVVSSPAVLAMSSTAMPDVPAMTFGIIGVERYLAWYKRRTLTAAATAAVFLALACLARSHAAALIPLAGALAPASRHASGGGEASAKTEWLRILLPLIAAPLIVIAVIFATRDPVSGMDLASATAARAQMSSFLFNFPNYLLHWVLAFPLAWLWPVARGRKFFNIFAICPSFVLAFALAFQRNLFDATSLTSAIMFILLMTLSVDVLVDIAIDAIKRGDRIQLVLLAWVLAPAVASVYMQLPSKLLVFAAPAMGILIARRLDLHERTRLRFGFVTLVIAAGFILSILVMRADETLAGIGKRGGEVVASLVIAGNRVWSDGAWGFQWYAMEAGAMPLARTAPFPQPGDIVVSSLQGKLRPQVYSNARLESREVFATPGGRIHGERAGFYTNIVGPFPWTWGTKEIGRIEVWRVAR